MRSARLLFPMTLLLVVLVAFWPAFRAHYTFDDVSIVQRNAAVHSLANWRDVLRHDYWYPVDASGLYRPLTLLSFAAQWSLFPDHTAWLHGLDLLLHVGVAWLIFALGRRIIPAVGAAFAALWFALLPTHVEVVVGLVGRADLLAALGALLALLALDVSLDARRGRALLWAAAAGSAAFLALLSKESALPVTGMAALWIWCRPPQSAGANAVGRPGWKRVLTSPAWWAIVGATLAFGLIRVHLMGWRLPPPGTVSAPLAYVAWPLRVRTATWVALQQVMAVIWPFHLAPDYSFNQIPLVRSWLSGRFWVALMVLLASGLAVYRGRRRPGVLLGAVFALLAYLPVSNLLFAIGTTRANRLMYLPAVGVAWLLGAQVARLKVASGRSGAAAGLAAVLLLLGAVYAITDVHESHLWQDNAHLMRMAVERAPDSANAHFSLGYELSQENQPEGALREYRRAVTIYPAFSHAWWGMAGVLFHEGRMAEAAQNNLRAFNLEPTEPIFLDLAEVQLASGEASAVIPEAHRLPVPVSVPVAIAVARAYLALQQYPRAASVLSRVVTREPDNAVAHFYLAAALHGQGNEAAAQQHLARALALNPGLGRGA